jgi:hypothetical protein
LPALHKEIVKGMPPYQTPNLYRVGASDKSLTSRAAFRI